MNAAGEVSELAVIAEGEDKTSWFIWLLVCCTSISGLLFGECQYAIHQPSKDSAD